MNIKHLLLLLLIVLNISVCQRTITPEAKVFNKTNSSVFTVYGDRGHGSGFLFDLKGLILTNQHVVAESKYIRVQINDSTKVAAKIVASNSIKDIAVLYINPEIVNQLTPLTLAIQSDTMVYVGERVIAIGSPLNQKRILTSGIVSGIEETAIISDVNMNPGNSGGPLINMNNTVIGINTFGDFANRGPGVYGSIIITEAKTVIEEALNQYKIYTPPSIEKYPVDPKDMFPLEGLKDVIEIETFNERPYRINSYTFSNLGEFEVRLVTPPYSYFREKRMEKRLADKMNKRKGESTNSTSSYDLYKDLKNWAAYLGYYKPVVQFEISPKIGRTNRSLLFNVLSAATSSSLGTSATFLYEYEYKGDFVDFRVKKDGKYVEPIRRELIWQPLIISASIWRSNYLAEDLAQAGVYTFSYDLFEPEIVAIEDSVIVTMPDIQIEIIGYKDPKTPYLFQLPDKLSGQVLSDFLPYSKDSAIENHLNSLLVAEEITDTEELNHCLFVGGGLSAVLAIIGLIVFSAF